VVVRETLKVRDLKAALLAALPPSLLAATAERGGTPLELSRLRVYKRAGARAGVVLRDGRGLRQVLSGGFVDKEVAVQLLAAHEALGESSLLLRWQRIGRWAARTSDDPYPSSNPNTTPNSTPNPNLNANPTPTPTPTLNPSPNPKPSPSPGADGQLAHAPAALHAQGGWPVAELRAALAAASGVDAERLRVAKPPAAASGKLTAQALSALRWDEPKLMTTPKISMYPLQLRDGDLLLVRDAEHPPPAAAAAAAAGPGGARGRAARGRGARGGARGGGGVSCAFVGKPRREEGIRIHTVFDQPPAAASEATPAAKEAQETVDDVLVGVEKLEVLD